MPSKCGSAPVNHIMSVSVELPWKYPPSTPLNALETRPNHLPKRAVGHPSSRLENSLRGRYKEFLVVYSFFISIEIVENVLSH